MNSTLDQKMSSPTTSDTVDYTKEQTPAPVSANSDTSHHTQSHFLVRTPRTPGGGARNGCTLDEALFFRVAVHTAKCTECDKRNRDTMRRCPGCTFQVCQPCYQKRQREGKGLVHGNMPTPGGDETAIPNGSGLRTARKKPHSSISSTETSSTKLDSDVQEQPVENAASEKESDPSTAKPNNRKRAARTTPSEDSSLDKSTEDKSDSDDISPTSNKRARTGVSFAGGALNTAVEEPPATPATPISSLATTHKALISATLKAAKPKPSVREPPLTRAARRSSLAATHEANAPTSSKTTKAQLTAGRAPSEPVQSGILYENAIKNYKEPLLARREPVLSNPIAHIPAIVKRGGKPRPSAEQIYQNIQEKVREKLSNPKDVAQDPEVLGTAAALFQLAVHSRELDRLQSSTVGQDVHMGQAYTVQEHIKSANAPTVGGNVENEQSYPAQQHTESAIAQTARKNAERAAAYALQEHMRNIHTYPIQGHVVSTHASTILAHTKPATASTFHYTVRDFVRHEAVKYQNNPLLDQDDNNALFNMLQSGALIWGKQTYRKQTPEAQSVLRPGLNLRLDAIDKAYTTELQVLMVEQAARVLQDLIG